MGWNIMKLEVTEDDERRNWSRFNVGLLRAFFLLKN